MDCHSWARTLYSGGRRPVNSDSQPRRSGILCRVSDFLLLYGDSLPPPFFFPGDWMLSFIPPSQATGIAPLQILTVSEVTVLVGIWAAYAHNYLRVGAIVVYSSFIVARYRVPGKFALEKCPESLANTHTPTASSAFSHIHRGGTLYRSQLAGCDVQVRICDFTSRHRKGPRGTCDRLSAS